MRPPNVVLVMTDDQGYGDLGCTGNPWLRTPCIDAFHGRALRLTDFHVSPLCTPTRGALMTGHRPVRNGAWATCWGRSILRRSEVTMAEVFAASGYRTGMFGKWHLGDNYPYRPQDRGFQHVVAHKGGGVGQTPDYWGNSYFDDTYFHNGVPRAHEGYCTDVWFDEALAFIEASRDRPFFAYIATNAPHSPYLVADRHKAPYLGHEAIPEPAFYGMIASIDENFGRLERRLEDLGLTENTILIFMTDNGSSGGCVLDREQFVTRGYNAGLRGRKASYYDGGHRVPCFARWPAGGLGGGRDVSDLVLHLDLLPTFIELCGLDAPAGVSFDGRSAAPLLRGEVEALPDRLEFVQYRQHTEPPEMWRNAVLTRRWRLVGGRELYDIGADPGQREDVSAAHPEVVARLRAAHEDWWAQIAPGLAEYCPISLGHPAENPTRLCAMDVLGDVAWHQGHILQAQRSTGQWAVAVERPGRYRFALRRWPEELGLALGEAAPADEVAGIPYGEGSPSVTIDPVRAWLGLAGQRWEVPADGGQSEVAFEVEMSSTGPTRLDAWFVDRDGEERGAFYVTVERR
ncbi:MAG: arylsulfatase [Gemmatimonadota bacterium]